MLNTAIIMGRLTFDPELRHTTQGLAVTRFTVAVDRSFQKAGTPKQTDFIDVVCWRQTAEFVSRYFKKGSMIAIEGTIQTGSYEKDGIRRKTFELLANNVSFCGEKRETADSQMRTYQELSKVPGYSTTGVQDTPDYQAIVNQMNIDAQKAQAAQATIGTTADFEEITGDEDLPF